MCIVLPIGKGILGHKDFKVGIDIKGGTYLLYQADLSQKPTTETDAQAMVLPAGPIRDSAGGVNGAGTTEPIVQLQGNDRILEQIPG